MRWRILLSSNLDSFQSSLTTLIFLCLLGVFALLPLKSAAGDSQIPLVSEPLEFSAKLIWKTKGRKATAQLFVKHNRYRIEHMGGIPTDLGYAGVTIVRLDEQKVWYILSQRRTVMSVPLTRDYLLPFSVELEGEISRTLIGDAVVGNSPALLFDVEVQNRLGKIERYYEWVDPKRDILLKLLSQERDWFVEYEHVVLSSQPDYYFEPPLGYRIIEAQEAQLPKG